MKLNVARVRGPLMGLAATILAVSGVAVTNVVTRPASSSSDPVAVQLAQPAADEATTTTTGPMIDGQVILDAAGRAENAAGRAEVAATKAETAATKAEQIVATTTTSVPPPATPFPVVEASTTEAERVTTTTAAPKQWVVVARFPVAAGRTSSGPALTAGIDVQTGLLRVRRSGGCCAEQIPIIWFSDMDATPSFVQDSPDLENGNTLLQDYSSGTRWVGWRGPWATGNRTVTVSAFGDWDAAPFTGLAKAGEILIEEYR